jgi:TolC family type I secretion outer membrane protein
MTRSVLTILTAAALLGSVAFPALAQDQIMTADEMRLQASQAMKDLLPQDKTNTVFLNALAATYENNPTLKAARAEARAVFERLPQAEAGWRPRVTVNADVSATNGTTEPDMGADNSYLTRGASLNLNQPLYRGGRTLADTETAKNVIRAQIALLDRAEQLVLLDAVTAYLDVLQNEALLKLATNNRTVINRQLEATQKRFEVGELTRTDVAQAEARLARAESGIITAQAALRSSRAEFVRVIGYQPENLGFPMTNLEVPKSLDEATGYAETQNPNVRAAQYAHRAAESDIDSQYGNLLPEVSLSGDLAKSYKPTSSIDNSEGATVGVVASFPLYEAGAVRSRVRQSKKTAQQRYSEILEAKRDAREQTITAWENLQAARGEVISRMAQVEASEVARFGVKQEADLGARTILDTLDADQEVLDAQVALVTASRNEVVAIYSLAAALGVLTPQTLGFGDKVPDYNREVEAVRTNIFGTDVDSR